MKIVIDEFNSNIFGIRMGNIIDIDELCTHESVRKVIEIAKETQFNHLSVKINSKEKNNTNVFLSEGFDLVDTQLMYYVNTNNFMREECKNQMIKLREKRKDDEEKIINIAKSAYEIDQYHSDVSLDNKLCDIYYSEWIKNCCEGFADRVLVAVSSNNEVAGYLTLDYKGDNAVAGLVAVDKKYHGNGIFTFMLNNTLKMLYEEDVKILFYGTQLSNTPVLKVMGHLGGYIDYSLHVMHLML